MAVDSTHPEYNMMQSEWSMVKACSSGQREVKALKTQILPAPGEKSGKYNQDRYKAYLNRAIYTNVTGRTKQGLTGAAFRLPQEIELSTGLEYLEENADGSGQSIEQLSKDVFAELLESGRECLLVDYPEIPEGLTQEQINLIEPKATIKRYSALDFINWKTTVVGGNVILTLAVLCEQTDISEDEFAHNPKKQYRVLRLTENGYSQQVYIDGKPIDDERFPRMANGSNFDFIPLFVVGSQNNDISVDEIPLADIAYVNVGHYRNSADLEESSYITGQPVLHIDIGDMDETQWKALNPNGVAFGSSTSIQTVKGSANMLQVNENQLPDRLQERKEGQMLALGAKLVEKRNPNETAAAAKIDATGENSVLSDLVANVEEGIRKCIEWCGLFMGDESEFTYNMNRKFFDDSIDPQTVMAAIQGYDRAILPKSVVINAYRKSNIVPEDMTDEDILNELGQVSPLE